MFKINPINLRLRLEFKDSIFLVNNFEFLNTEMMQVIIENEKENEIHEVD